jgi:hypothetical protein
MDRTQDDEAKDNALALAQQALEAASSALEKAGDEHTRGLVRSALIEVSAVLN